MAIPSIYIFSGFIHAIESCGCPKMPRKGDGGEQRPPLLQCAIHVAIIIDVFRVGLLWGGDYILRTRHHNISSQRCHRKDVPKLPLSAEGFLLNFFNCSAQPSFGLINFLSDATLSISAKRGRLTRCAKKLKVREYSERKKLGNPTPFILCATF